MFGSASHPVRALMLWLRQAYLWMYLQFTLQIERDLTLVIVNITFLLYTLRVGRMTLDYGVQ